jgi:hypothetical protein
VDQLLPVLKDAVGDFASLTVPVPLAACCVWWSVVIGLLAYALWLGNRRERLVVGMSALLALAFPVLFWAWIDRYSGFGLQGREVLPELMLIPLVPGEVIFRHRSVLSASGPSQLVLAGAIGLLAIFQGYAWWLSARAAAGAPGTLRFYAHAIWRPPLGWAPWIVAAVLGVVALLSYAGGEALRRSEPRETQRLGPQSSTGGPLVRQV